ncbi:MAG: hypothetical protein ABIO70_14470 [Pseudomonadota bacterium]
MIRRMLEVTLLSDAIFTASSATIGRPASLDRLPGATLLGAAAARCYPALEALGLALGAFHLGEMRFGDGLPVHPELGVALPVPLSWHERKYGAGVIDLSQVARPAEQLSRLGGGLVVRDGAHWHRWDISLTTSMRTAIDEQGKAREGLLYGFEAVPAGTRYHAELAAVSERALEIVTEALCGAPIRVGRSRSAEFGEAVVRVLERTRVPDRPPRLAQPGRLRVLCLSDLALVDPVTGSPRLDPRPEDLDLPRGWRLDLDRSFLRSRRYSPFNGHRRRPDMERQVIEAGSVITFTRGEGAADLDLDKLSAHVGRGVGEQLSSGLGHVLVEPPVLSEPEPCAVRLSESNQTAPAPPPSDPVIGWLLARQEHERLQDATWFEADRQAKEAAGWNVPRSQWGRLRGLAAEARLAGRSREQLLAELKNQIERGVAGDTWARGRGRRLLDWFDGLGDHVDPIRALELLGRRVPRHMAANEEKHHA